MRIAMVRLSPEQAAAQLMPAAKPRFTRQQSRVPLDCVTRRARHKDISVWATSRSS